MRAFRFAYTLTMGVLVLVASSSMTSGCAGAKSVEHQLPPPGSATLTAPPTMPQVLDDLAQLAVPSGVDSADFLQMKATLADALQRAGSQQFSAIAPTSPASTISDLDVTSNADGSATFSFTYQNQGDYNQDSQVYVSDLTTIGQNYDKSSADPQWVRAQLADGNNDGMVTISDITPIGQYFMYTVEGYELLMTLTPQVTTSWQKVLQIPFDSSSVPVEGGRRVIEYTLIQPEHSAYYRVRPYCEDSLGNVSNDARYLRPGPSIEAVTPQSGRTGAEIVLSATVVGTPPFLYTWDFGGGALPDGSIEATPAVVLTEPGDYEASLSVADASGADDIEFTLSVRPNQSPVASLSTLTPAGVVPLAVGFDASGSSDSDGTLVDFAWDWDGNGTWDSSTGANPLAQHVYAEPGEYHAAVQVTDDCGDTDKTSLTISAEEAGGWAFLVWVAADNNLAQAGFDDIEEMEAIGSTEEVTILVGYDIDPAGLDPGLSGCDQVHFIKVVQDTDPASLNTTGDPANVSFSRTGYNSADPGRLVEFLDWADTNFPAAHQALVLWDHGSGWRLGDETDGGAGDKEGKRRNRSRGASGVLSDDVDGPSWSCTSNAAIISALSGRHFDILAFDACLMADVESLYEYRLLADWIVGSETTVPFDGFAYVETVTHWNTEQPAADGISRIIVDDYIAKYVPEEWDDVQLAVLQPQAVAALTTALGELASAIEANAEAEATGVKAALQAACDPWGDGTRDLFGFLTAYRAITGNSTIVGLIDAAQAAADSVVVYTADHNMPDALGLSVFLPDEWWWEDYLLDEYRQVPFNQATGWLAMLEATVAPLPPPEANWVPGDKVVIAWFDDKADIDIGVTDPSGNWGSPWWPDLIDDDILFSLDSYDSGLSLEWAQLRAGAEVGDYVVDADWWWHDDYDPPPTIEVSVKIYDSADQLKTDMGLSTLEMWAHRDVLLLHYDP